jgi:VCBS repeat-containing protein
VSVPAGPVLTSDTFTVTASARDAAGNVLFGYWAPATWSDSSGTLSPASPSDFVNGVSRTTGASVSKATSGDRITIQSGGKQGTSAPFDVNAGAPVLSNIEVGALQYAAGSPGVPVTSSLTVSSATSTLAGATVSITSGLAASEDSLGFTNQNGVTGGYNSGTGVLTLSGTASVSDYQTALQSVTYSDSNGATPSTGARTISFQVDDGNSTLNLSNVVSRAVDVNPNSPPTAGDVTASTDKHTATDINVLAGAGDPDGDVVMLQSVNTSGTKGSVSINPDSTVHYDPNGQFQGLTAGQTATDSFGYTVSDGFHTAGGTVTVTINGVNDPPVISNLETAALSYRAQDPAVPVTSTLALSDDDDDTIAGATVAITSSFSSAQDSLEFTNQNRTGSRGATTRSPGC